MTITSIAGDHISAQAGAIEQAIADKAGVPLAELHAMSKAQQMAIAARFEVVLGPLEVVAKGDGFDWTQKFWVLTAAEYAAWRRGDLELPGSVL